MLVKLPEYVFVNDEDKVRYTDGSMSVTLWFDTDNSIFAFEIIFDLLMNEMALLYSKKSPPRYVNIVNSSSKIGRTTKQSIGTESFHFPANRITEFEKKSSNLPDLERDFILKIMHLINKIKDE